MSDKQSMSCAELAKEINGEWVPSKYHSAEHLVYLSDQSRLRIAVECDHSIESMGKIPYHRDDHPNDNAIEFANELSDVIEQELSAAHLKQLTLKFAEQLSSWQMEGGQRNDLCGDVITAIKAMPGFQRFFANLEDVALKEENARLRAIIDGAYDECDKDLAGRPLNDAIKITASRARRPGFDIKTFGKQFKFVIFDPDQLGEPISLDALANTMRGLPDPIISISPEEPAFERFDLQAQKRNRWSGRK